MSIMNKGLLILASLLLTACNTLQPLWSSSPSSSAPPSPPPASLFEGVNEDKIRVMNRVKKIKTEDLYGAWSIVKADPVDFMYLSVFLPNHTGLNYLTVDEKDGLPESEYSGYHTWEFDEKTQVMTLHSYKIKVIEKGGPETVIEEQRSTSYDTQFYTLGDESKAVKFSRPDETMIFIKLDDATYRKLVKDPDNLPAP